MSTFFVEIATIPAAYAPAWNEYLNAYFDWGTGNNISHPLNATGDRADPVTYWQMRMCGTVLSGISAETALFANILSIPDPPGGWPCGGYAKTDVTGALSDPKCQIAIGSSAQSDNFAAVTVAAVLTALELQDVPPEPVEP